MSPTGISSTLSGVTYATAPFNHDKADIILRSSDNVDFRVFRLFLSLASPFFQTLFNVPQPIEANTDQELRDSLAVIPVAEDSKTLDSLLRFCYPCTLVDDPELEVLRDAMDVLEAARKYSLDVIEKKVRQAISNSKFLQAEPLRCFAIAHRGRLREETLLAARYTLTQPLIPPWFPEVDLLTASDLLSLLTYHQRCGEAVYALRLDLSWITSHYGSAAACSWLSGLDQSNRKCGCTRVVILSERDYLGRPTRPYKFALFDLGSLQWWEDFMEGLFAALRDQPCEKTVQASAEKTVQIVKASIQCQSCPLKVTEGMRDLVDLFTRKIHEVVSQIELELEF